MTASAETGAEFRRVCLLTAGLGVIGFVSYLAIQGLRPGLAFAAGVLGSFGNLWMWNWLVHSLSRYATNQHSTENKKPSWQAGSFIGRYVILLGLGYVIVRALDVSPLAIISGLLASTAAVLISLVVEIISSFFRKASTH